MQPIEGFVCAAVGAGVGMLQLREKALADGDLLEAAIRFARACREHGALFIVNDRVDVALAAGADGVHLGQDDLDPVRVRAITGQRFIIGLSTHSPAQIDAARALPVDYIGVGPIFETPTKPGRPAVGVDLVRYAAANAAQPFFAIGGIDPRTVGAVIAAGASRVSVLRWIARAEDPATATRDIMEEMARHRPAPQKPA